MDTLESPIVIGHITSSDAVVHTNAGCILFGCISEAIKYLDLKGNQGEGIQAIVLSDTSSPSFKIAGFQTPTFWSHRANALRRF